MGYCLNYTYKNHGITGFYRGLSALVILSTPKTACRFSANEYAKNNLFTDRSSRLHTFCAGLFAGVTEAIFVVTPAETIKVKLIHDKFRQVPKYNGLVAGLKTITYKLVD